MKKGTKIALIVAAGLCGAGLITMFAAAVMIGFDFTKLQTHNFTEQVYEVEPVSEDMPIQDITIKTSDSDVRILPSEDDSCRVVCRETEEMKHFVSVKGNELTISQKYAGKWYEQFKIMIFEESQSVTVYLPEKDYHRLDVKTVSGEIDVAQQFTFDAVKLCSTSGDIHCAAQVNSKISVDSTSGEVVLSGMQGSDIVQIEAYTTSGDITLKDVHVRNIVLESTSGEIELECCRASNQIQITSTSGDVDFDGDYGGDMVIRTVSGEVSGILYSSKQFFVQTVSGDVSVPQSEEMRPGCKIVTTSGDVHLRIREK